MQRSILTGLGLNPSQIPPETRNAGRWKLWLVAAAALLFVIWLIREQWLGAGFEWQALARSFVELDWRWLSASVAMALFSYVVRALRWRVMLRPLKPGTSVRNLISATMIGFTAVTLVGRPGELVRPYLISRKENLPLSSQIAAWFLERIWDLLAFVVMFGYAMVHIGRSREVLGPRFEVAIQAGGYLIVATGVICLIVLVVLNRYSAAMRTRLLDALAFLPEKHHRRADGLVTAFLDGAASTKNRSTVMLLLLYTVAEWLVIILSVAFLFGAYPGTAPLAVADIITFTAFVACGSLVQIPGIGGGVQIAAIVVLNELFHVPLELATGMAIMIWVISWIAVVPVGLALEFREGLNWRQFRALEREAAERAEAVAMRADAGPGQPASGGAPV